MGYLLISQGLLQVPVSVHVFHISTVHFLKGRIGDVMKSCCGS